jgi:hypothetical protein
MKISEKLIAGKKLIENPDNWIKGYYAKIKKGDASHVSGNFPEATCFCSIGAIQRVTGTNHHWGDCVNYLDKAAVRLFESSITNANDELPHESVMVIWDKAIEIAKYDEVMYGKH